MHQRKIRLAQIMSREVHQNALVPGQD